MCKKILLSIFLTLGFCLGAHALSVNTILGSPSQSSWVFGNKSQTKFSYALSAVKDSEGNIFLLSSRAILKMDLNGQVSIFAGSATNVGGFADGNGTDAMFDDPEQIAIDSDDNLYLADADNHRIRKITPDGVVTTIAGDGTAGDVDGAALSARFNTPRGVAVDLTGKVYVSDANHKIKVIDNGTVTTIAGIGSGHADGDGLTTARFYNPYHIFLRNDNELYIADFSNDRLRKLTFDGSAWTASTIAGVGTTGNTDGDISVAEIARPMSVVVTSNGDVFATSYTNHVIKKLTGTNLTTVAGIEEAGFHDGNGSDATFYNPRGMYIDSNDDIYLADYNNFILRLIKPYSNYEEDEITVMAGDLRSGNDDGKPGLATFNDPFSIAQDSFGNFYVSDFDGHRIRKILTNGSVITFAGDGVNASLDGTGTGAKIGQPLGLAIDSNDNVFVTQPTKNLIRKITPAGVVTTFAGSGTAGSADGNGTSATLNYPYFIDIDSSDNIYVADYNNCAIRKISPTAVVTTLINTSCSNMDGYASNTGKIHKPLGIAVNDSGTTIYISEYSDGIKKITDTGSDFLIESFAGGIREDYIDAKGKKAAFSDPRGITLDSSGNLYVADSGNNTIRKISPSGQVTTVAGSGEDGNQIGSRAIGSFTFPIDLEIDNQGDLVVVDYSASAIKKVKDITNASALDTNTKIDDLGSSYEYEVSTVFGSIGANRPGPLGLSLIDSPQGISVDSAGNIYLTDIHDQIRKVDLVNQETSLFAGSSQGDVEGDRYSAKFYDPLGMSFALNGSLYVADAGNDVIKKVLSNGSVSVFAGSSAGNVDDTGTSAKFNNPVDLVHDSSGNLYVTDQNNHSIRKITPAGVVTTLAGGSGYGYVDGQGSNAKFYSPKGLAIDSSDNLYVADFSNNRIRKVTPSGMVTTIAGSGSNVYKDGNALEAGIYSPYAIAVDSEGEVYFSEGRWLNRIRKLSSDGQVSIFTGHQDVSGALDGDLDEATFYGVHDLYFDDDDNLYVTDHYNDRLRKITKSRVSSNNNSSSSPSVIFVGGGDENSKPGIEIYHSNFDEVSSLSLAYAKTYKLKAFAYDGEDGQNIYNSLIWTSDIDGNLGSGRVLDTSTLSEGTHTLTANVIDSGGLNASATVTINILDSEHPETEDLINSSVTVDLTRVMMKLTKTKFKGKKVLKAVALSSDNEGNITDVSDEITWTSDLDGVLNKGSILQLKKLKAKGTHTISANYRDEVKTFKLSKKRKRKRKKKK